MGLLRQRLAVGVRRRAGHPAFKVRRPDACGVFTHTDGVLFDRAYYQIVEGERRRPVLEEEVDKLAKLQKVPHPRLGRT